MALHVPAHRTLLSVPVVVLGNRQLLVEVQGAKGDGEEQEEGKEEEKEEEEEELQEDKRKGSVTTPLGPLPPRLVKGWVTLYPPANLGQ